MQKSNSPISEPTTSYSRPEPQAKAGFSQVDLLTVIGVLLLLGLVLTPALAHTRATDQAFVCRNNLGRLMIAWRMYSEDHNGQLCGAFQWVGGWLGYSAGNTDNTNYLDIINGPMGPYARNWMLWKCPADQSVAFEGGVLYPRVRTISMSQMFRTSSGGWTTAPPYRKYIKASDMIRPAPANLWVLVDENPDSVNDAAFGVRETLNKAWISNWRWH